MTNGTSTVVEICGGGALKPTQSVGQCQVMKVQRCCITFRARKDTKARYGSLTPRNSSMASAYRSVKYNAGILFLGLKRRVANGCTSAGGRGGGLWSGGLWEAARKRGVTRKAHATLEKVCARVMQPLSRDEFSWAAFSVSTPPQNGREGEEDYTRSLCTL